MATLSHLTLTEGIVERCINRLRGKAESSGLVAIDVDRHRHTGHLSGY